jgi:hypothetical protein
MYTRRPYLSTFHATAGRAFFLAWNSPFGGLARRLAGNRHPRASSRKTAAAACPAPAGELMMRPGGASVGLDVELAETVAERTAGNVKVPGRL